MRNSHRGRNGLPRRSSTAWRKPRSRRAVFESLEPRLALSGGPLQHMASQAAVAGTISSFTPAANAFVYAGSQFNNYGNANYLLVQNDSSSFTADDAEAYLRFNTSSLGGAAVAKAILTLTPIALGSSAGNLSVGVQMLQGGGDVSWTEGTGGVNYATTGPATWYNTPNGAGQITSFSGKQLSVGSPISIDVTSLVNQNINTGGVESFIIGAVSWYGRNQAVDFASREYATAGYRPMLTITTAGPVVPPPSVAAQTAATNVTSTSAQLSVLGSDGGSAANLIYSWSLASGPSGAAAPTFSANTSNAAKNTSVTFHEAGSYTFIATITNFYDGLSTVSSPVTVTIAETLTGIQLTPAAVNVAIGATQQFAAAGIDQFGLPDNAGVGKVSWSMTGAGSINATSGLYTAPTTWSVVTGTTITATAGSFTSSATVTLSTAFMGMKDPTLSSITQSLDADGSISRNDVIQILRTAETLGGGVISQGIMSDLKTLLADASALDMPGYVQVLAGDVINGNTANAHYQGQSLGNLGVGSTAAQLDDLIDKWFLGTDLPSTGGYGYSTINLTGSIFSATSSGTPSHLDEDQGELGDCYLISSLGTIADSAPAAIQNMIVDNGVDAKTGLHTWTVRFYSNGTPDYVTVDNMLPTSGGRLVFDGFGEGLTNPQGLWIALIEKAYAQWNETGKEGRDGSNTYTSIQGGWMADVDDQVLGHSASSYNLYSNSDLQALITAMTSHEAVTIGTDSTSNASDLLSYGLYGSHAYAVVGYNAASQTFTLYNPWGTSQPTQALTWSQLQATTEGFVVANASGTQAYATSVTVPKAVHAPRSDGGVAPRRPMQTAVELPAAMTRGPRQWTRFLRDTTRLGPGVDACRPAIATGLPVMDAFAIEATAAPTPPDISPSHPA